MNYEAPKLTLESQEKETLLLNPLAIVEPLIRNRWIILFIIVVCSGLGVLYNLNAIDIYLAQSTIIIRRTATENIIRQREANLPPTLQTMTDFNTKVKLIASVEFAEQLVRRLIQKGHFALLLKTINFEGMDEERKNFQIRRLANRIRGGITVENPRNTYLVKITYESPDRRLARDVVNELADIVVEYGQEEKRIIAKNNLTFLESKVEEARLNVEKAEKALYEYRKRHGLIGEGFDLASFNTRRNNQIMRLNSIQEEIGALKSQIAQLDDLIESNDFSKYTPVGAQEKSVLGGLHNSLVQAKIKYEKLLTKFEERHPEVIQAKAEVEIIQRNFIDELIRMRNNLEFDLNVMLAREADLKRQMDDEMAAAVAGTEKDIEGVVLENAANSERQMYNILLDAVKEVSINLNANPENVIYVQEYAMIPERPIRPNKKLNLLLSALLGIFLGMVFAYGREYLDFTIRNPEDVRKTTQLPVLSSVPLYVPKGTEEPKLSLYITQHPKSLFSESITSLRTHLNIKLPQEKAVALAITSSAPKEGKSLIAANLACSMALDGRRTILIDGDLHRPVLHKAFALDKQHGLFDLIVDALNPRWADVDLSALSFGDLSYLIKLKQWSGVMKIQWNSLGVPLMISYQGGKPVSSNIRTWQEKYYQAEGSPPPVVPVITLAEEDGHDYQVGDGAGPQAVEFIHQYPRLRMASFFHEQVLHHYLKDTPVENLFLLTAGTNPKNPSEILGSDQMAILLQLLKERFERIIIDCPPAWPLSDVSVLSPLLDGLIWICRAGETPKSVFVRNVDHIRGVQPNIIGTVINAVDLRRDRYYYYGYSYYYYRYYKSHYSKEYGVDLGEEKAKSKGLPRRRGGNA